LPKKLFYLALLKTNKLEIRFFLYFISLLIAVCLCFYSCRTDNKSIVAISTANTQSHNVGQDCMSCHGKNGEAKSNGWFVVAGTVFQADKQTPNPNAIVTLYSQAHGVGNVVHTIQADANGNFYTTEPIDFGAGLYPVVQSSGGAVQYMNNLIRVGSCNGCHNGANTDRINSN
jgi:hypothetical protein